jgi:uncharacterized protein
MAREYIGAGFRFPILPDAAGRLGYSSGDANVEQSLRVLLLTRLRERRMRPALGTVVHDALFSPGSTAFLSRIENSVREAVRDWEPRVQLLGVQASLDPEDETRAVVAIEYLVRRTQNRLSLVFPYYLEEGL